SSTARPPSCSSFIMVPPLLRPTLFTYTTLFRSADAAPATERSTAPPPRRRSWRRSCPGLHPLGARSSQRATTFEPHRRHRLDPRSEEHTSELQSRENLVCRLLLEKKKSATQNAA